MRDAEDSAPAIPRCVVIDDAFDWEGDVRLNRPWAETVIYELHVKGFTKRLPGVREDLRGTYAGLASEAAIDYLRDARRHRGRAAAGAPHRRRATSSSRAGSRTTGATRRSASSRPHAGLRGDRDARRAGARVQGDGQGAPPRRDRGDPRRGLQPHGRGQPPRARRSRSRASTTPSYYRLVPDDPRYYMDFTGTGNTLNPVNPRVLRLIMDSLRYWVMEMHVDGFRFDLASALARELYDVDRLSAFFDVIHQDPVLSQVKLIAEPWDVGARRLPGGQLPGPLDRVERHVPRHDARLLARATTAVAEFAARLHRLERPVPVATAAARSPRSTSSPATTASRSRDLVSYDHKHNEANLEDNRDGTDDNRIVELRRRGRDGRPGGQRAARPADSATSSRRCCSRRARRCCSPATSCAAPSTATTTRTARTTSSRGSTGSIDERGRAGSSSSPSGSFACAPSTRCSAGRAFLTGEERQGSGAPDVWWFRARRAADDAGRLVARRRVRARRVPERRRDPDASRPTASRSTTTRSSSSSTPGTSR